jgi:hypothetical protein
LEKVELAEGALVALVRGLPAWEEAWTPRRDFEEQKLPAVRAPKEGVKALAMLAAIAQAA